MTEVPIQRDRKSFFDSSSFGFGNGMESSNKKASPDFSENWLLKSS